MIKGVGPRPSLWFFSSQAGIAEPQRCVYEFPIEVAHQSGSALAPAASAA